jgi:acetyl esterase/lipase
MSSQASGDGGGHYICRHRGQGRRCRKVVHDEREEKYRCGLNSRAAVTRHEIYVSPLQATVEQLKGLPPALIQVAESDILGDEGEAYGRKLDEGGVKVTTVRCDGMIHDFGLLNSLAEEPAVRSLFEHAAAELKRSLQ